MAVIMFLSVALHCHVFHQFPTFGIWALFSFIPNINNAVMNILSTESHACISDYFLGVNSLRRGGWLLNQTSWGFFFFYFKGFWYMWQKLFSGALVPIRNFFSNEWEFWCILLFSFKLISNMSACCYGDFITIICSGCMKLDCRDVL